MKGTSMQLAALHGAALSQGATATARAIAAELDRRSRPNDTLVLHRGFERSVGTGRPLAPPFGGTGRIA